MLLWAPTYRVLYEASLSLATCLLASLEPVLVAPVDGLATKRVTILKEGGMSYS